MVIGLVVYCTDEALRQKRVYSYTVNKKLAGYKTNLASTRYPVETTWFCWLKRLWHFYFLFLFIYLFFLFLFIYLFCLFIDLFIYFFLPLVQAKAYSLNSLLEAFRLLILTVERSSCEGRSG